MMKFSNKYPNIYRHIRSIHYCIGMWIDRCVQFILFPIEYLFFENKRDGKLRVKFIVNWNNEPTESIQFHCKEGLTWNNIVITNSVFADYYVIVNRPNDFSIQYYNPKKTIYLYAEPYYIRERFGKYWCNPPESSFLSLPKERSNWFVWNIKKHYSWLKKEKIIKNKKLSTVTSDLYYLPGHRKRLDFIHLLDKAINIDVYGRTKHNPSLLTRLRNYKGPLDNKDDVLLPYKYIFASENCCEKDYFTEKIIDAIVSECLCFYWGCPNIEYYIDERAYIKIDLDDPDSAIAAIKQAIENNEWEKRLPYIKQAKQKILDELQIMPTVERIIKRVETA